MENPPPVDGDNESSRVKCYDLGPLGHLLACTPSAEMNGATQERALPIVILDRSGSMDAWVEYSRKAISSALQRLGYRDDDSVVLITFDSVSDRVRVDGRDPTVKELVTRLANIQSRGSTRMSSAISKLVEVLRSGRATAYTVLVVSDGRIDDQDQTVRRAAEMATSLQTVNAAISATLLRLQTSSHARPDTRALACVGSFCNTSKAAVTDVDVSNRRYAEVGLLKLTESIVEGCGHAAYGSSVEMSLDNDNNRDAPAVFHRLPTSPAVTSVRLITGTTSYVLVKQAHDHVRLGQEECQVEMMGTPRSEAELACFFEFVEQQLKMWTLMGTRKDEIQTIVDWFGRLQSYLDTIQSQATEDLNVGLIGRARAVVKSVKKRVGSIIDRIRQLGNAGQVNQLNAQQQADWLRGVTNTRSGRRLARRANKNADGDLDFQTKAIEAVKVLAQLDIADDDDEHVPVSFYSQASFRESLQTAQELVEQVDELQLGDILQCIGGLGVPFEAAIGDYTDCWSFRVKRLFIGQTLAEADVWLIRAQSGNSQVRLECPGQPNTNITGVIALKSVDDSAYGWYTHPQVRPLFDIQASAQIRHTVAPVPHDALALSAAGAWFMIQRLGREAALSSVERDTLDSLIGNVRYLSRRLQSFEELYATFQSNDDIRHWLSGDRDISGILKPIAVLLRLYPEQGDERVDLPHIMRALYYLDAYMAAKRAFRVTHNDNDNNRPTREQVLSQFLAIDLETRATPLQPLFEPEPEQPVHYEGIVPMQPPQWIPCIQDWAGLYEVLCGEAKPSLETVFGVDSVAAFVEVVTVQSLLCTHQSDRIDTDTRTSHLPDPVTEDACQSYLRSVVRSHYEADYKRRLAAKQREEECIALERTIDVLVAADSYETFERLLLESPITNHQHPGYDTLAKRLLDLNEVVAARTSKLALLMTGRNVERGDPAIEVWANGNFLVGDWEPYANVLVHVRGGQHVLRLLRQARKLYGTHRYRDDDNRHGHSNEFPSFWAMGYKDLYHMQQSVPEDEFRRYLQAHCRDQGCCMPHEVQRAHFGL